MDSEKTAILLFTFATSIGIIVNHLTSGLGTTFGAVFASIAFATLIYSFICLKNTFGWRVHKKWLRILTYIFGGLCVFALSFVLLLGIFRPQMVLSHNNGLTTATSKWYNYQFSYSAADWALNSSPDLLGGYWIVSKKDPTKAIVFGYKDSQPIQNIDDLVSFAQGDAEYAKNVQNYKVSPVSTTTIGNYEVTTYDSDAGPIYFFSNFQIENRKIYVWFVNVNPGSSSSADKDIQQIVSSFRII